MHHPAQFIAAAAFLVSATAGAHQNSVTPITVRVEGRAVTVVARIDALDLNEALALRPAVLVDRATAVARSRDGTRYLATHLRITDAGEPCTAGDATPRVIERADGWSLELAVPWACAHRVETLRVDYGLFFDVDPRHRGLASIEGLGPPRQFVFETGRRLWNIDASIPLSNQLAQYVRLGVEHIFTGYDHVAFVVALLVLAAALALRDALRHVLAVVSSFTAAHSLTLIAATLGWVSVPARVVEPVIALSIFYVASSNLRRRDAPPPSRPATTFVFGLVHGLGFASVLRELGLPARATVTSLLAFNAGVEIGQLAVVLAVLPLLHAISRRRPLALQLAWTALISAVAIGFLPALGVPRGTLVTLSAVVAMLVLAGHRWGYARAVRPSISVVLATLALLWTTERLLATTFFSGVFG